MPEWHPPLFTLAQQFESANGFPLINGFVSAQVDRRLNEGISHNEVPDMLSHFLPEALAKPDPEQTRGVLRHVCDTNIIPGADTTAIAICTALMLLSQHRDAMANLRTELESIKLDELRGSIVTPISQGRLPYMQAVVQEALRLHPAVGMQSPRVVPSGGRTISCRPIPEGVGFPEVSVDRG